MSQIHNVNTKRPKPKENQPGILGISSREFMHSAGNLAEDLGFSTARFTYLSLRIHPKSYCIFPLKVAATLLSGSGKGTVGAY